MRLSPQWTTRLLSGFFYMSFINQTWKLECEGWHYLYVSDRVNGRIPTCSGIYCFIVHNIFEQTCSVQYVGKSANFASRLKYPHPIEKHIEDSQGWVGVYIQKTTNQDELEIDFIRRYRPLLNIQHNGA